MAFREEILADGVRLILGDCREVLPTLEDIDAVVSDPPYGIGYRHSGGGGQSSTLNGGAIPNRATEAIIGDDCPFDPSQLLRWPACLFGADHFCHRLPETGSFHVWDKHCGTGVRDSFSDAEFIWTSRPGKTRIVRHLWKGVLRDSENNGDRRAHPSQKPIAVMKWCIQTFSSGETILDPFMGSGTTGVAAVQLGRKFTGIEIDPKYFEVACRRIRAALDAPDMFVEKPRPLVQSEMLEESK